jgi:3-methyladenine DNA glycosylase/8-oxoguanine DNA glycosylase
VRLHAEAPTREVGLAAIDRMRFALGTDHDLGEFHRRFRRDPLIGPVIRRRPWLRPRRRPEPFEALAWAVCEQLIEGRRASAIERKIVRRPNIGNWTIEMLAFEGQGRDDMLPALDLAYVKLVGQLAGLGRRATEDEVREFFAPYGEHAALAGIYALHRRYL